jgi:hypothetical protein
MKKKARKEKKDMTKANANLSLTLTIAFIIIVLAIIFFVITSFPEKGEIIECEMNDDCMKVQTTCCPCEMGGIEKCVPRAQAKIYKPSDCPEHPVCIAQYNCDVERCSCIDGECTEIIGELE